MVTQACDRLEALDTQEATLTMDIQAAHLGCSHILGDPHLQACQCTGQVSHRLVLTEQLFSR